ncbi:MAG: hypothetical protein H6Q73_1054 [Firmicutes bacterium]|nr:hypothetical protein [Bacillota bacterium]
MKGCNDWGRYVQYVRGKLKKMMYFIALGVELSFICKKNIIV